MEPGIWGRFQKVRTGRPDHSPTSHFDNEKCFFPSVFVGTPSPSYMLFRIWLDSFGSFWIKVKLSLWLEWSAGRSVLTNGKATWVPLNRIQYLDYGIPQHGIQNLRLSWMAGRGKLLSVLVNGHILMYSNYRTLKCHLDINILWMSSLASGLPVFTNKINDSSFIENWIACRSRMATVGGSKDRCS